MTQDQARLLAALDRVFAEANNGLLKLAAYNAVCRADISQVGVTFFAIASQAVYNDMFANALRALDEHPDAASFWYIKRCNEAAVLAAAQDAGVDLSMLAATSTKLRKVRDKTHFHVDRKSIPDPSRVWEAADLDGGEFGAALRGVATIASQVKRRLVNDVSLEIAAYDGSDVARIIAAYEAVHGSVHGRL